VIVYQRTTMPSEKHTLFVCPSVNSDSVEFRNDDGSPRTFQVTFYRGRAEVPNNLGRWMVDNGYGTSLILPAQKLVSAFSRRHG
jgi:hypothetical protein